MYGPIHHMAKAVAEGAGEIAGGQGKRMPIDNEIEATHSQGRHVAWITARPSG